MSSAWSFGKSQRGTMATKMTPGPGHYSSKSGSGAPRYTFGNQRGQSKGQSKTAKLNVPGPGHYSTNNRPNTSSHAYTMASKTGSMFKQKEFGPGPGQYTALAVSKNLHGGQFGIKTASTLDVKNVNKNIGPGSYNQNKDINKSHYSAQNKGFGTSNDTATPSKKKNKFSVPGPGMYNAQGDLIKENACKFGSSLRNNKKTDTVPGPGQYNQVDISSKLAVSMKHRPQSAMTVNSKTPGPGAYTPNTLRKDSSSGFKIPKGLRGETKPNRNPGPGSHFIQEQRFDNKGSTFGPHRQDFESDRTKHMRASMDVPGAGQYNIQSSFKKDQQGFSMVPRRQTKEDHFQPGPGKYDPNMDASKASGQQSKIGTGDRSKLGAHRDAKYMPGPGAYNVHNRRENGLSYVFGSDQRSPLKRSDGVPGPGAYKVPVYVADVPKYLIPNQNQEFKYV